MHAAPAREGTHCVRKIFSAINTNRIGTRLPDPSLDPVLFDQILGNLLDNAMKFSGPEGRVAVVAQRLGANASVSIEDDGPGIPPERRDEAIRPFVRLDAARNQDRGQGAGLGLAIAADIARTHGGELRLSDGARLGGLRAEIVIPR